jgi:hypothetical protein
MITRCGAETGPNAKSVPLLDRIEDNGIRAVVVEDASRSACDLAAQELGILLLIKGGSVCSPRRRRPVRHLRSLARHDAPDRRRIRSIREKLG